MTNDQVKQVLIPNQSSDNQDNQVVPVPSSTNQAMQLQSNPYAIMAEIDSNRQRSQLYTQIITTGSETVQLGVTTAGEILKHVTNVMLKAKEVECATQLKLIEQQNIQAEKMLDKEHKSKAEENEKNRTHQSEQNEKNRELEKIKMEFELTKLKLTLASDEKKSEKELAVREKEANANLLNATANLKNAEVNEKKLELKRNKQAQSYAKKVNNADQVKLSSAKSAFHNQNVELSSAAANDNEQVEQQSADYIPPKHNQG